MWAVREPHLLLPSLGLCRKASSGLTENVRSNFVDCPNPLVWGYYVSFIGCRVSFTSPFLPIIESVGFSLPVAVPERTENYFHSFRKLLTYGKKAGDF